MRASFLLSLALASVLACLLVSVSASVSVSVSGDVDWVQPSFVESLSVAAPTAKVAVAAAKAPVKAKAKAPVKAKTKTTTKAATKAKATKAKAKAKATKAKAKAKVPTKAKAATKAKAKSAVAAGSLLPSAVPSSSPPAASAGPAKGKGEGGRLFSSLVGGRTNERIWASTVSAKVKSAIADYQAKKKLPNGLIYGQSVRALSLIGKSASQVEAALKKFACTKEMQVMKAVETGAPLLDAKGQTIPMIVFLCPDGGAIRLKPIGDPTSRFRPQPHGVKALRFPFDSAFATFDDEIIKIDNKGSNPLPKWGKDLATLFEDKDKQFDAMDAWADRAHADLKK